MGYVRHHAIIVTSARGDDLDIAHAKAIELLATAAPVTGIGPGVVNSVRSFAVLPDGSKEGWRESDHGDEARAAFIAWLTDPRPDLPYGPEWVEVEFGGDDPHRLEVRGSAGRGVIETAD